MSHQKQSVFIIVPVHNRKNITLKCLEYLAIQRAIDTFQVVIIDDGCTDGTAAAVAAKYPQVHILSSTGGNLWWTGAIKLGMQYAYEQGAHYIIWLNDDTLPKTNTFSQLITFCKKHPKTIAASQCYYDGAFTYGGQTRHRFRQTPAYAVPAEILSCDALDGNAVCLPRSVIDDIGYPPANLIPHYGGDNIYTWSAKQAGYKLYLLGDAISICPRDHPRISWTQGSETIWQHWQAAMSPKASYYWWGYWNFCLQYWGILGIIVFLQPYLRLILFTVLSVTLPPKWLCILREKFGHSNSL
ncbi:MAG: glycosyltransferase family 2 protein [Cyanobacteria bacterium P01_D01_bin.156]